MTLRRWVRWSTGLSFLCVSACAVTRPLPIALDAPAVSAFLAEHPQTNLQVTEHSGRKYWIHAPLVRGDSLIGQRRLDVPVAPRQVPLTRVAALGTSHFSWGRTGVAVAGTLAVAAVGLAVLIDEAQPIYALSGPP
jgi:hypothetical protein